MKVHEQRHTLLVLERFTFKSNGGETRNYQYTTLINADLFWRKGLITYWTENESTGNKNYHLLKSEV
jgi:hypothetical protein